MKVAFYKANGDWLDKLTRWWTGQPYTHCELIFPTGESFSASGRDGGTRFKIIDYKEENWDIVEYYVGKYEVERMYKIAKNECGKKYDFFGIFFSHIIGLSRQNPDKWFCSEICGYLLGLKAAHRLTPGDLFNNIKQCG